MNLVQLSEQLKDVPDDFLQREITQPTGAYPSYLVISEMTRRKRMRDKAMKQEPSTSVAEDLMGINAIPQAAQSLAGRDVARMGPPQQPMPPQMPPQMMPQMPPQQPAMMADGGLVAFQNRGLVEGPINFDTTELPIQTDETGEYVDIPGKSPNNFTRIYKDGRMELFSAGLPEGSEIPPVQTKNAPLTPVEIDVQTEIPEVYSSPIIGPGDSGTMTVTDGMPQFTTQRANPFGEGVPPTSFDPYRGQGGITQEAQEFPKKEFIESQFRKDFRPLVEGAESILESDIGQGLRSLTSPNILRSLKEGVEEGVEYGKGIFGGIKDYFVPRTEEDIARSEELRENAAREREARRIARQKQLEREREREKRYPSFGVKEVTTSPVAEVTTNNKDDKLLEDNISKDNKITPKDTEKEKNQKRNAFNVAKNSLQSSDILNQMEQFKFMTPKEREAEKLKGEKEFEKKYTNPLSFLQDEIKAEEKRIKRLDFDNMNNALIMAGAAILQSPGGRDLKWLGTGLQGFQNAYTQGRKDILDAKKSLLESRISLAKSENDFAMNKENAGLRALEMAEKSNDRFNSLIDTKFANWVKQVELTQKEREIGITEQYYGTKSELDYVDPDDVQKIRTQLLLQFENFDELSPAEQDQLIQREAAKMGKRYIPSVSLPGTIDPDRAGVFSREDFNQ